MNEDLLNNPENPCESNTFWGGATLSSNRKGFTLAETLLVVVILGLIAALTVPNLINKQKETTQRTKVKKAMATYEEAVNKMLLEHDRSFSNLNTAGCNTKTSYFKYIKRDTANTCIFQAPDKLWWDVSDIERPLIAFEQSNLTVQKANATDNKDAFVMVGRYDDQGILRVDDLNYETLHSLKDANNYESKDQLEKLYGFINNVKNAAGGEVAGGDDNGDDNNETVCDDMDFACRLMKTDNMKSQCPSGDLFTCAMNSSVECEESGGEYYCYNDLINAYNCYGSTFDTCEGIDITAFDADESYVTFACDRSSTSLDDCTIGDAYTMELIDTVDINSVDVNRYKECNLTGCSYYFNDDTGSFEISGAQADGTGGLCYDYYGGCEGVGYGECTGNGPCCQSGSHFDESTYTCVSNE